VVKGIPDGVNLSFSQAQGLEPLPQSLALGEVSLHFRTDVWNWLYTKLSNSVPKGSIYRIKGDWATGFTVLHASFFHGTLDTFDTDIRVLCEQYKSALIGNEQIRWNQLFDLIQFILRLGSLMNEREVIFSQMKSIFQKNLLAYDIIEIPPAGATIVPTASPEEGDAIREAFTALESIRDHMAF
jgi:hypothetical protein